MLRHLSALLLLPAGEHLDWHSNTVRVALPKSDKHAVHLHEFDWDTNADSFSKRIHHEHTLAVCQHVWNPIAIAICQCVNVCVVNPVSFCHSEPGGHVVNECHVLGVAFANRVTQSDQLPAFNWHDVKYGQSIHDAHPLPLAQPYADGYWISSSAHHR